MTAATPSLRIAYADPPYPGQSEKRYADHPDFAGEVDHRELVERLISEYDGYVLHTASTTLRAVEALFPADEPYRVMQWVKPFAAFKRNVSVAYAYEPVIVKAARKPVVKKHMGFVYRDWLAESITLKRGLTGVKPEKVVHWLLEMVGAEPEDTFHDLYLGTGAVTRAWSSWVDLRSEQHPAVMAAQIEAFDREFVPNCDTEGL